MGVKYSVFQIIDFLFQVEKYHGGDINNIIEENKRLENMIDDTEKMEVSAFHSLHLPN